ncbi:MAG TPA: ABC transporter permease subunit [Acidimicrobiales bacterium]|nr:ABC transporter permease subunit [Acidimicrobiales bacterium]
MTRSHGTVSILGVLAVLVLAWQCYIWIDHVPFYVLPSPWSTLQAAGSNLSLLGARTLTTLAGAALGLAASLVLAVALALTIVRWPLAEHVILTYALLIRTLPIVGVAPIMIVVAGRNLGTSVLCVVVITVFSLLIATIQGFESVPREIVELSDLYASPFLTRLRTALLPSSVASILQGLRLTAPLAVLGALLAEWLDGFHGLSAAMVLAEADQDDQLLMAACITAVLLALGSFALVELATALAARRGYRVDDLMSS